MQNISIGFLDEGHNDHPCDLSCTPNCLTGINLPVKSEPITSEAECGSSENDSPRSSVSETSNELEATKPSGKLGRPLKASGVDLQNVQTCERYKKYRHEKVQELKEKQGGKQVQSNPKMCRFGSKRASDDNDFHGCVGDDPEKAYRQRRNNAPERCIDRHKKREDEMTILVSFLERENKQLKKELIDRQEELQFELARTNLKLVTLQRKLKENGQLHKVINNFLCIHCMYTVHSCPYIPETGSLIFLSDMYRCN